MALPFFYLPDPGPEDILYLDEANSKHAVAVLRMQEGEQVNLTNGKGLFITAVIVAAHKKKCGLKVLSRATLPRQLSRVTIAISPVKNNVRLEWFFEKAAEIGVAEIIPIICQRTEKLHFRFERMHQILVSAMLQSQQVWLPELHEPKTFKSVIELSSYTGKWIAHCLPEERKSLRAAERSGGGQILLIGPEGDFTASEIDAARKAGYKAVILGDTRLRTETAGMVGAALLCIS
jgi:16S rRNA (uracil1498-N3)-methyltransferase